MLLNQLMEAKKDSKKDAKQESEAKGTYVGARFSDKTVEAIKKLVSDLKIPNPLAAEEYHTTVIYSRNPFPTSFRPLGQISPAWVGKPEKFHVFQTRDNKKNALVIVYSCAEQTKRHEFLMKEYEATYDFPEYILHLTLSYDIGDFEYKDLDFSKYIKEIVVDKEYEEELNFSKFNKDKDDEEDDE